MKEVESFGVTYERYAINRLLIKIAKKYKIKDVLEIPAYGAKAMPGIYSLGFAIAGCDVYLINVTHRAKNVWHTLGFDQNVHFIECRDVEHTELSNDMFDLVWNCLIFTTYENPDNLLKEMIRVSKKYILITSVNAYNLGFPWHRLLHIITRIPWTHGNTAYNRIGYMVQLFKKHGLKIVEIGVVDTPPWPDTIGFRDIRLHRMKGEPNKIDWNPTIVDYIKNGKYPQWIELIWKFEKLPVPLFLKLPYSHIFYVLGSK